MKKWLVVGGLVVSMSCINSTYAVDPVTTGIAAGAAAKIAAEGTAIGAAVAGAGVTSAVASPLIGVAGGVGTAYVMNDKLFSECEEIDQNACKKARIGTYAGAGLGTAGALGAIGLAGANTAGLAAIGSAVGGGAIAGAAALVAAPIVAAAAIGGLAYWWYAGNNEPDTPATPAPAEAPTQ